MTGKEEFTPTPDGLNTLIVRQSSDMFVFGRCRNENEFTDREGDEGCLQAVSTGDRNSEHRMTEGERGST
jgi:hypothetical protein